MHQYAYRTWPALKIVLTILILSALTFIVMQEKRLLFFDNIDLIFHEAGHALTIVAPEWITVISGTLMQLIIPGAILWYFYTRGDHIGTSAGTWWLGQSMVNVSVYIADARAQELFLLGGGGHDWNYLLETTGLLEFDTIIGSAVFYLGCLVMWGGVYVAIRHLQAHVTTFEGSTSTS